MRRKKIFNLISALTIVALLFNTSAIFVHAEDTNLKDLATELSKDLDVDLGLDDSADKDALSAEISKVDEQIKQLTSELNEMDSYIDSSTYAMIQSILEIQGIIDGSTSPIVTGGDTVFSGTTTSPSTSTDNTESGSQTLNSVLEQVKANKTAIESVQAQLKEQDNDLEDRIKNLEDTVQINRKNLINFSKGSALLPYSDTTPVAKGTDTQPITGNYDFSAFNINLADSAKLSEAVKAYLSIPIVNSVNKNTDTNINASLLQTANVVGVNLTDATGNIYLGVDTNVTIPAGILPKSINVWNATKRNPNPSASTYTASSNATTLVNSTISVAENGTTRINLPVSEKVTFPSGYYDSFTVANGIVNRGSTDYILTSANNTHHFDAGYYDSFDVTTNISNVQGTLTYYYHHHSLTNPQNMTTVQTGGAYSNDYQSASSTGCFTTPVYKKHTHTNSCYTPTTCSHSSYSLWVQDSKGFDGRYNADATCNICGANGHGYKYEKGDAVESAIRHLMETVVTTNVLTCGKEQGARYQSEGLDYYGCSCGKLEGQIVKVEIVY